MKKIFTFSLAGLVALYVGTCAYLYANQASFVFDPNQAVTKTPKDFGCAFEEVKVPPNGLSAFWIPNASTKTLILHHGNTGNIGDYAERACQLRNLGFSVLAFDYRGYGNSKGEFPSETRIYEDADAAFDFVTKNRGAPAKSVVFFGHSMGAAVAVEMGLRHPEAGGVIAESAFTSVYDMGVRDSKFRYFPVSWILNQRMDSINKVARLKLPIVFIHGDKDKDIPPSMSESLFAAASEPKKLLVIAGADHDNVLSVGANDYASVIGEVAAR